MADTTPADAVCSRGEALDRAVATLRGAGIDGPRLDARLLLAHALAVPMAILLADLAAPLARHEQEVFQGLIARRAGREPVALILGRREFWSLDFLVSPATLVPRADSETVIEAALAARPDRDAVRAVLDLGTGTGCLLLAALTEFPRAFGVGIDRVPEAALLARTNAARLGLGPRAAFAAADWAAPLAGRFDVVLGNPPYIPAGEIAGLMPEVALHEPSGALAGGADGLDSYRAIMPRLREILAPGGIAVLEIGQGQADAVAALARGHALVPDFRADLSGIDRAAVLRLG